MAVLYCVVCGHDLTDAGALVVRDRATGALRAVCRPTEDHPASETDRLPCFRRNVRSPDEDMLVGVWYALPEGD